MSEPSYHGTRQPILDFVAETMNGARIQAELGITYAEIGDVAGLKYALRNLIAYVRATAPLVKEMDKYPAEGVPRP